MIEKALPKRKKLRLQGYDYSQNGCYFVTVCTKDKKHLLSHIKNVGAGFHARPREIIKTPLGFDVEKTLFFIANKYNITVDNYIIMPNHIHLLLTMENNGFEAVSGGRGNPPLPNVIGQFKSYTTKLYRERIGENKAILWQRGYYDRIVRNQEDFEKIWNYVEYNALKEYSK